MPAASLNAMEAARPPAIVQPATRNCAYYEQRLEEVEKRSNREKGEILKSWKESGTWKEKYSNWGDACEFAANMTKSWANRLIADVSARAVSPADALPPASHINEPPEGKETKPETDPSQDNHKPEKKAKTTPKPKVIEPEKDKTGWPIPQPLIPLWERRSEIQVLLDDLSEVKARLTDYMNKGNEPMWSHQPLTTLLADVENVWRRVKQAMPFAVCPTCDGKGREACKHCRGWGFLPEYQWSMVSDETKAKRNGHDS